MAEVPQQVDNFLDTLAAQQAAIDDATEKVAARYEDRLFELLSSEDGRDEELWADAGADVTLTFDELSQISIYERDEIWTAEFSAMLAAAQMQAYVEIIARGIVEISDDAGDEQAKEADKLSLSELRIAARAGVTNERVNTARERRNG